MPSYTFSRHARMCSSCTAERAEGESTMRWKKEAASERETRRTRRPALCASRKPIGRPPTVRLRTAPRFGLGSKLIGAELVRFAVLAEPSHRTGTGSE
jgi:hypothetical protein